MYPSHPTTDLSHAAPDAAQRLPVGRLKTTLHLAQLKSGIATSFISELTDGLERVAQELNFFHDTALY